MWPGPARSAHPASGTSCCSRQASTWTPSRSCQAALYVPSLPLHHDDQSRQLCHLQRVCPTNDKTCQNGHKRPSPTSTHGRPSVALSGCLQMANNGAGVLHLHTASAADAWDRACCEMLHKPQSGSQYHGCFQELDMLMHGVNCWLGLFQSGDAAVHLMHALLRS